MKTCPYCAEEIQDAAIVCRYCGRDLIPVTEESKERASEPAAISSVWKQGSKASIVLTVLTGISMFVTSAGPADLVGNLLLGLPVTYLFWWVVCAGIIWLWRKLGGILVVTVGGVALMVILIFSNKVDTPFVSPPTATSIPSRTPRPALTKTSAPVLQSNCSWWYALRDSDVDQNTCVQGFVKSITGNTINSASTRIYLIDKPSGLRTIKTTICASLEHLDCTNLIRLVY